MDIPMIFFEDSTAIGCVDRGTNSLGTELTGYNIENSKKALLHYVDPGDIQTSVSIGVIINSIIL
jgi:hypothetical protein